MSQLIFNLFSLIFIYENGSWVFDLKNRLFLKKIFYTKEHPSSVTEAFTILSGILFEMISTIFIIYGLYSFQSTIFLWYVIITFITFMFIVELNKKAKKTINIIDSKTYKYVHVIHSFIGLVFGLFILINYNYHLKTGSDLSIYIFK